GSGEGWAKRLPQDPPLTPPASGRGTEHSRKVVSYEHPPILPQGDPGYHRAVTGPMTGVVLSGGGARGAYEAGVMAGIVEVLGPSRSRAPFDIFTGTSVGAINASWLAAHADQ